MEGFLIWLVVAGIISLWCYRLAEEKGKRRPVAWAIGGFFFNVVPLFALGALHSPEEIRNILSESGDGAGEGTDVTPK